MSSIVLRFGLLFFVLVGPMPSLAQGGEAPLTVTKTVRARSALGFAAGGAVEYTIEVGNGRAAGVGPVTVSDGLDLALLDSVVPLDGGVLAGGRVEWNAATTGALRFIPAGGSATVRLRARIRPDAAPGSVVRNGAQAQVVGEAAVGEGQAVVVVAGVVARPAVRVTKQVMPGPTDPGATLGYAVRVENTGAGAADGVRFFDVLPAGVDYVAGSTTVDGLPVADLAGRAPFADGLLVGRFGGVAGRLGPGEAVDIGFDVRIRANVPPGVAITNVARVVDGAGTATEGSARFLVGGQPDLSAFTKTAIVVEDPAARRALVGQTLEWTLTVANAGDAPAIAAVITDPIEANHAYVTGSLVWNGVSLSDAPDADRGSVVSGVVTVDVGDLAPGEQTRVVFRTRVTGGPSVRNQATVQAARQAAQPSDDGGQDSNAATVIVVGEAPRRGIAIDKTAAEASAGSGEAVRWILRLANTGTVDLTGLSVTDALPPELSFEAVEGLPPGADFETSSAADGGAVVRLLNIGLPAGEAREVVVITRVDPALAADAMLCNRALFEGPAVEAAEAEACIDAEVRQGRLAGLVFEDGDDDGTAGSARDHRFAGMTVALSRADDPDGPPVAEASTDAAGAFVIPAIAAGAYRVRVFTATGVLVHTADATVPSSAPGTGTTTLALAIDPSGRVYNSVTGALVDGAEVFIYRDEDRADADPYDAESLARRVLVPPADLESATQQGQRTANGGLYRFAVRRPGRYLVEVVPPGASFTSPSVLVPPVPGTAFTDDPQGRVVPADLPSVDPDADRTYFLAFDLNGPADFFQHNHIPIDPLTALVDLRKRALRPEVTIGEIVTFEIDLTNRSPTDLLFDPATATGGVIIQDILPRGLKYVGRTATLARVRGGIETPIAADDPLGRRILRFGRFVEVNGALVQRPLDLRAGEALRLRYHTIVSADAEPLTVLHNRALALADGNIPISATAQASIRVLADPDFDQGLLLGRVWCDTDRDGRQQPGEPGLPGARLYLDNGYRVTTDAAGNYHFQDIDPGTHAVKLDTATLLPGAALTTDETRVHHFTRGLPAKIDFGVTCPTETHTGATLELAPAGLVHALAGLRDRAAVFTGDVDALRLVHDTQVYTAPPIALTLLIDGQPADRPDLPPGALGAAAEISFRVALDPTAPSDRWGLYIGLLGDGQGDADHLVAGGAGPPPAQFTWDQRGPDGQPLLRAGAAYRYRLEVAGPDGGLVGSPAGSFGVGLARPAPPEIIARLTADDFDRQHRPRPALRRALQPLVPAIIAAAAGPDPLVIEVHHDGTLGPLTARAATRRRAEATVALLESLGVPPGRLTAEGLGGSRPLWPNISAPNRRRNRRIDIIRRLPPPADAAEVPAPAYEPQIRVDARALTPDAAGRFTLVADVPPEGVVEVLLQAADGRRAMFPITLRPGTPRPAAAPRPILIEGTLPDALTLGGRLLPPPLPAPRVTARAPAATDPLRFTLEAPPAIDGWRFTLRAPDGEPLHTASGLGPPPAELEYTPDAPLAPGAHTYQLTVRQGATVAQSAPGTLGAPPPPAPAWTWTLRIDGRPAEADPQGRVHATRTVEGNTPFLLEATAPDGARVVFFAHPPPADGADGIDGIGGTGIGGTDGIGGAGIGGTDGIGGNPGANGIPAPPIAGTATPAIPAPSALASTPPIGGGSPLAPPPTHTTTTPTTPAPPLPALTTLPIRQTLPDDARAALADFGRADLLTLLAPILTPTDADAADIPARNLTVELPPPDAPLPGRSVPIRGTTAPGNRIYLAGAETPVDPRGHFAGHIDLPPGATHLEITTQDPQGNRGHLRHPVRPADDGWFLLALGETITGQLDTALDGVHPHTRLTYGDRLYLHGRAAAWLRGHAQGSDILDGLFDHYTAEIHLDTARRAEFETAFRQLIDPQTFYPVYGDAADLTKPVNTRGPLYVLLQADENTARVGNFLTDLQGIELFRYDRALYGAALAIDDTTGPFRHQLDAFAADTDLAQRHAYIELRGTGGSLYYLPHRELIEGSERIYRVERDRISGTEHHRTPLARDTDYTLRYDDGRLLLTTPLPSVTQDPFGARQQPDRGEILDGHPVYLAIEYDHHDPEATGDTALGVRARETWNDAITLGAGYAREGRPNQGQGQPDTQPDYQLWGADLTLRAGRRTRLEAEIARSQSQDAQALRSDDGGLTFTNFHDRPGTTARGTAYLIRGGLELDDLIGQGTRDHWYTEGYYQLIEPGFYSGGTIQQQGLTKYGAASRYAIDAHHTLTLRHDTALADAPLTHDPTLLPAWSQHTTRAGYGYRQGALSLDAEYVHTTLDPGPTGTPVTGITEGGPPIATDAIAGNLAYQLTDRWTALVEQELILRSDERLHQDTLDLLTTSIGARYRLDDTLHLEAIESLRWSGANATQIGLRSQITDRTALYLQERYATEDNRTLTTTVIGGEQRFAANNSGRAFGEYQLEAGTLGDRNRAVLGIGKRFQVTEALTLDAAYERSHIVAGEPIGESSRDAISLGVRWLDADRLQITGRYELRYEDNDETNQTLPRRDRTQLLTLNAIDYKLDHDLALLARLNYSLTYDLQLEASEAELLELSLGLAWRPAAHDWLATLVKYTKRYDQRPYDLLLESPERTESDVISIIPIVELPWRFQLVSKLVLKRSALQIENLPTVLSNTLLWLARLNYHLTATWDAGLEYRVLTDSLSATTRHGTLLELNYIIQKRIRLGAGYNFTSFSDDEYADLAEDFGGPFFRVTAHY